MQLPFKSAIYAVNFFYKRRPIVFSTLIPINAKKLGSLQNFCQNVPNYTLRKLRLKIPVAMFKSSS